MSFYRYIPYLFFEMGEIWYNRAANNASEHCEFRENRRRRGRASLMGVSEITFTLVQYSETAWHSDTKQHLRTVFVSHHL
jgi:hypothetical protein